jgi:hypothetical protein
MLVRAKSDPEVAFMSAELPARLDEYHSTRFPRTRRGAPGLTGGLPVATCLSARSRRHDDAAEHRAPGRP